MFAPAKTAGTPVQSPVSIPRLAHQPHTQHIPIGDSDTHVGEIHLGVLGLGVLGLGV